MTKQKKEKKNKLIFLLLVSIFFQSQISYLYSDEIKCKKFDFKCKSQKFLDETKEYQKRKISDGQKQLNQTKEKLNEVKDEAIKRIPKIK